MFPCTYCDYTSRRRYDVKRHEKALHKNETMQHISNPLSNQNHFGIGHHIDNIHGLFDIRLKEILKHFVTGPSRCTEKVFVSKLLEI